MKFSIAAVLFILLLCGCQRSVSSNGHYYNIPQQLNTSEDSTIQFIYYCDTKQFDKAVSLYPFVDSFTFSGVSVFMSSGESVSYLHFPFNKFTSADLLLLGIYADRKFDLNVRVLDFFLRQSILLNHHNYIALLELAKLGILNNDALNTYCLLQFAVKSEKYGALAKEMIQYCKKGHLTTITVLPDCKTDLNWICSNVVFGYFHLDSAGHNEFSMFKRTNE